MSIKARPGVNVDAAVTGSELHYRINPDNSTTTIASGTPTIARNISFRQGYDVEGYHKLKRLGKLIPFTPWNQLKYSVSWTGRLHYRQPSVPYNWKTDSNWSHPISLTPWNIDKTWFDALAGSKDTTRYVQSAASAIYSQNFDALTFLSELHKTVAMFKQATIRLFGIAQAFRRFLAKKGKIFSMSDALAEFWLEYRYGWRILYFDIVDIQNALSKVGREQTRFKQRAGANEFTPSTKTYSYAGPAYQFTVFMTEELQVKLRGSVIADIQPPLFQFNPLTTSWELIRFSFIIDWFIGIGTWLETLSFLALETEHTAAGGLLIDVKRQFGFTSQSASSGYQIVIMEMQGVAEGSYAVRTPLGVPKIPLMNVRVNVPKVADLLAIIYSFYTGQTPGQSSRI